MAKQQKIDIYKARGVWFWSFPTSYAAVGQSENHVAKTRRRSAAEKPVLCAAQTAVARFPSKPMRARF